MEKEVTQYCQKCQRETTHVIVIELDDKSKKVEDTKICLVCNTKTEKW